jgi:hypothetical protein
MLLEYRPVYSRAEVFEPQHTVIYMASEYICQVLLRTEYDIKKMEHYVERK